MVRKASFAGQFYESERKELIKQIEGSFLHPLGPKELPVKGDGKVKAAIVPHAGYVFSGPSAAHAYKRIGESEWPDRFIIIGPSHSGLYTCFCDEDWQSPLGIAENDRKVTKLLSEALEIPIVNSAHEMEHSIEVQIPFIQYISKGRDVKIVPLMISYDIDAVEFGKKLHKELKNFGLTGSIILISSDFTHFGPNYGYQPFKERVNSRLRELDMRAIGFLLDHDPIGFLNYVEDTGATICGALPMALLVSGMDKGKSLLLSYYTSSDIIGERDSSVSYASIIFF